MTAPSTGQGMTGIQGWKRKKRLLRISVLIEWGQREPSKIANQRNPVASFNHLVGAQQDGRRDVEAERLAKISGTKKVDPVMLPPGRARLPTRPRRTKAIA